MGPSSLAAFLGAGPRKRGAPVVIGASAIVARGLLRRQPAALRCRARPASGRSLEALRRLPAAIGAWRCHPASAFGRGVTAQRTGEAAWHRRNRRKRAQARTLLRVASATALLSKHHSAQGMGKGGKSKGENGQKNRVYADWVCPLNSCSYVNFGYRTRCRICEAHPSERKPPSQESGARGGKGGGSSTDARPTLAERQLEAAKAQQKQQQQQVAALRKEKAALERKLASAAKEAAETPSGGDEEDDEEMEDTENVEQELEKLVRRRKALSDGGWDDDEELPKQLDE